MRSRPDPVTAPEPQRFPQLSFAKTSAGGKSLIYRR